MTTYDRYVNAHITVNHQIKKLASNSRNEVKYMSFFNHLISTTPCNGNIPQFMQTQPLCTWQHI